MSLNVDDRNGGAKEALLRINRLRASLEQTSGLVLDQSRLVRGDVWLCLDVSESMSGVMTEAKRGASEFVSAARSRGYRVGLIAFGGGAEIAASVDRSTSDIHEAIANLSASGSTDMSGALEIAKEQLSKTAGTRTLCLVTDGAPDDRAGVLRLRNELVRLRVEIITLPVEGADAQFLKLLATSERLSMPAARGTTLTESMAGMVLRLHP